jgi:GNAT superfamily N-acetyltransferase
MDMNIRPTALDDAPLLTELAMRSKAYWRYDPMFLAACRPALTLTPGYIAAHPVFVLELEGRVAGFYSLHDLGSGEVDLDNLFVEPDAIGHGCGKRLWQHAVETARQLGFSRMRIEADPNAEAFFQAMGAERVGSVPSSAWPGRELPLLRLSLK